MRAAAEVMGKRKDRVVNWLVRESGGTVAKAARPHLRGSRLAAGVAVGGRRLRFNDSPVNDDANTAFGDEKARG